jgi:phosphoglycolate phosphatase
MIGDGTQDIGAGKAAGVRTVAVLGGFHSEAELREHAPDFVIANLFELVAIVTAAAAAPRSP